MAEFGKLNFSVSFNPTSAFPLDARSYFESQEAAEAAAAQAKEVGSTESVYYYGMPIVVVTGDTATLYVIQPNNTLKMVGSGTTTETGDHSVLINRNLPEQHPMEAITGLKEKLAATLEGETLTNTDIVDIWNTIMNP